MKLIKHRKDSTWHRTRNSHVTSSDAPVLMGVGYTDPYTLWAQKTGKLPAEEDKLIFRVGHALEPLVARELELHRGVKLIDPGQRTVVVSEDYPFMAATPDRLVVDSTGVSDVIVKGHPVDAIAEIKTAGAFARHDWAEGPSPYALVQMLHQMLATDLQFGYAAAIVSMAKYFDHLVGVEDHNNLVDALLTQEEKFYQCLVTDTPPDVDFRAKPTLMKVFAQSSSKKVFAPPSTGWVSTAQRWSALEAEKKELRAELKEIEREMAGLSAPIMVDMEDTEEIEVEGVCRVIWKTQQRKEYTVAAKTVRPFRIKVEANDG